MTKKITVYSDRSEGGCYEGVLRNRERHIDTFHVFCKTASVPVPTKETYYINIDGALRACRTKYVWYKKGSYDVAFVSVQIAGFTNLVNFDAVEEIYKNNIFRSKLDFKCTTVKRDKLPDWFYSERRVKLEEIFIKYASLNDANDRCWYRIDRYRWDKENNVASGELHDCVEFRYDVDSDSFHVELEPNPNRVYGLNRVYPYRTRQECIDDNQAQIIEFDDEESGPVMHEFKFHTEVTIKAPTYEEALAILNKSE